MNITTNLDWCFKLEKDGLLDKNFTGLSAEATNHSLRKLNLLSWPLATDFKQVLDDSIDVDIFGHGVRQRVHLKAPENRSLFTLVCSSVEEGRLAKTTKSCKPRIPMYSGINAEYMGSSAPWL
eukprot:Colp12_sorted_trinity150504_noHs@20250